MNRNSDDDIIIIVGDESSQIQTDGFTPHSSTSITPLPFSDIEKQWQKTLSQVQQLTSTALKTPISDGLQLEEITVGLTITAEGNLAFLAKLGAQGTVQVKFKRV